MTTIKQEKTLLDEFAMAALTGLLSNDKENYFLTLNGKNDLIKLSYKLADDMMKERQKYDN